MCSMKELRTYAEEHLGWARTAQTDRERDIFLKMAQAWLEVAAVRLDERLSPLAEAPFSSSGDRNSMVPITGRAGQSAVGAGPPPLPLNAPARRLS